MREWRRRYHYWQASELRDLRSPDVQKQTDEELTTIISKGKSGKMPAFESKLTKDQISEVVKFIRSLKM